MKTNTTVAELIVALQKLNPELNVFVGTSDCFPTVKVAEFTHLQTGEKAVAITAV